MGDPYRKGGLKRDVGTKVLRPDGLKIPKKRAQRAPKEARTKGTGPKGPKGIEDRAHKA